MKNYMGYYKIVSYILLVIAGFFALLDLILLLLAFANSTLLLAVFILTGVIIYSFTSFSFLVNNIQKNKQCKASLKDWIKVNAYVTIAFGVYFVFVSFFVWFSPTMHALIAEQYNQIPTKPVGFTLPMYIKMFNSIMFFFLFYALLLLSHVFISLRVVKQYGYLFGKKPDILE